MGILDSVFSSSTARPHSVGAYTSSSSVSDDFWDMVRKPSDDDLRQAWRSAITRYKLQSNSPYDPVIDDSLVPRVSKKVQDAYKAILKHDIYGARIYGEPGSGLSDSSFGQREIRTGATGESVFAKLLAWDGVLDHCVSFWSVWNPEEDGKRNDHGTDIDCILKFGDHILLVDVKNYRSGLEYHTLVPDKAMFCMYSKARVVAHKPYVFSANMAFAQRNVERYLRSHGSRCTVESFVVLVPSSMGQATLDHDIRWPGGIQAMSYTPFLDMLKQRAEQDANYVQSVPEKTPEEGWLASLVKDYGNIPLNLLDNPRDESQWPRPSFDRAAGIGTEKRGKSRSAGSANSGKHSRGTSSHSRSRNKLPSVPELQKDCSLQLLRNEHGEMESISFKDVSGFIAAGWRGSGMVVSMTSLIAALVLSQDVEVHIVDCNTSSYFERYEDASDSYVRLMDGIDLVCGEIQSIYTAITSRKLALKRAGTTFWNGLETHGLKPCFLFVNECSRLFDVKLHTDADRQSFNDINRYLRSIIDKGRSTGFCVVLSTQKPSRRSLPAELVKLSQMRVCFHVPYENVAAIVLGDGFDESMMFGEKTPVCQSLLWRRGTGLCRETFMTVDAARLDEAFPT